MATGSAAAAKTTIPEHKYIDLAVHDFTMDGETASKLHKIDGILTLILNSMNGIGINEPVPAGVHDGLNAIQDILDASMVRGGIKALEVEA